jgi:hypothetical protein
LKPSKAEETHSLSNKNIMIQEIKDLFTVTLAKRLSSPFISTFLLAWCVTNYDITLLVFSSNDWNTKISYISVIVSSLSITDYRVLWPLVVSVFYVALWPAIDMGFYWLSKYWAIQYKKLQMYMDKIKPITPDERDFIEDKLNKTINEFREEVIAKESKISEMETRYKVVIDTSNEKDQEIQNYKNELDVMMALNKKTTPSPEATKATEATEATEVQSKEYYFPFKVSDTVKKNMSLNRTSIKNRLFLEFNHDEVDDDIFRAFHDVNYDNREKRLVNGESILINIPRHDDHGEKLSDNSFWTLDINPKDLTASEILDLWYSDYQTNNGEMTEDEKSSDSTVYLPDLPNTKKYTYSYRIAQNVLKEGARHEVYIEPVQFLTFTRSDLNDEVDDKLFELYYDKSTNKMLNKQELVTKQPRIVDGTVILNNISWEITVNPKELTPTEILDLWYQDLTTANSNIESIQVQLDKKTRQTILNKQQDDERRRAIKARL